MTIMVGFLLADSAFRANPAISSTLSNRLVPTIAKPLRLEGEPERWPLKFLRPPHSFASLAELFSGDVVTDDFISFVKNLTFIVLPDGSDRLLLKDRSSDRPLLEDGVKVIGELVGRFDWPMRYGLFKVAAKGSGRVLSPMDFRRVASREELIKACTETNAEGLFLVDHTSSDHTSSDHTSSKGIPKTGE